MKNTSLSLSMYKENPRGRKGGDPGRWLHWLRPQPFPRRGSSSARRGVPGLWHPICEDPDLLGDSWGWRRSSPPGAERRDSPSPRHPGCTRSILHCEVGALPKDPSPPRHNFLSPNVRSPVPPSPLRPPVPPALAWKIPSPQRCEVSVPWRRK